MSKVIAFSSQKGGPGKTTMTQLVATSLFSQNIKVWVYDADYPQHSFARSRKRDSAGTPDFPSTLDELQARGFIPYPVFPLKIDELIKTLPVTRQTNETELIFLDLPGTLNVNHIEKLVREIDVAIIPAELEFKSYTAAMETVEFYKNNSPNTKIGFLWTKLKKTHNEGFRQAIEKSFRGQGAYVFDFKLWETVKIGHSVSTLFPLPVIDPFISEILSSPIFKG